MAPSMSVTFLGTGSAYPMPKKAASSTVFRYDGDLWMFDCGEGTQIQLMKSDLKAGKISKIFITHLHGDHVYGLPGLMCTISQSNQRNEPVTIYGPLGIAKYLRVTLGLSHSELCFKFRVVEMIPTEDMYGHDHQTKCKVKLDDEKNLHPCEVPGTQVTHEMRHGVPSWTLVEDENLLVTAGKLTHRIPCFGFVISERDLPGTFDINKLKAYGLQPGPICSRLQAGESITAENGAVVKLKDVSGPMLNGRKVVICGDSSDSSNLIPLAQNADVFIHEATLQNSLKETALERGHSTPAMAAEFALRANVKLLYLTHFSQRYTVSSTSKCVDFTLNDLKSEAVEVIGEQVAIAEDLQTFEIKLSKKTGR